MACGHCCWGVVPAVGGVVTAIGGMVTLLGCGSYCGVTVVGVVVTALGGMITAAAGMITTVGVWILLLGCVVAAGGEWSLLMGAWSMLLRVWLLQLEGAHCHGDVVTVGKRCPLLLGWWLLLLGLWQSSKEVMKDIRCLFDLHCGPVSCKGSGLGYSKWSQEGLPKRWCIMYNSTQSPRLSLVKMTTVGGGNWKGCFGRGSGWGGPPDCLSLPTFH